MQFLGQYFLRMLARLSPFRDMRLLAWTIFCLLLAAKMGFSFKLLGLPLMVLLLVLSVEICMEHIASGYDVNVVQGRRLREAYHINITEPGACDIVSMILVASGYLWFPAWATPLFTLAIFVGFLGIVTSLIKMAVFMSQESFKEGKLDEITN